MGENLGGYEVELNSRAKRVRESAAAYQEGWHEEDTRLDPETTEFAKRVFESLDLDVLKSVLLDEVRRSGVRESDVNTEPLEKILIAPIDSWAHYDQFLNAITISSKSNAALTVQIRDMIGRGEIADEDLKRMQLFIIHEICHAFSRNRIRSLGKNTSKVISEGGYRISRTDIAWNKKPAVSFQAFNEGVTQRIAEETFLEYGRRIGKSEEYAAYLSKFIKDSGKHFWQYYLFGNHIDHMCERIAEYIGVPQEVVWNAIKRGYFANPELHHEETMELFAKTFGEDFLEEYEKFNPKTSVRALGRFDGTYMPDPDEYADKWLKHLGISQKE